MYLFFHSVHQLI